MWPLVLSGGLAEMLSSGFVPPGGSRFLAGSSAGSWSCERFFWWKSCWCGDSKLDGGHEHRALPQHLRPVVAFFW